MLVTYHSLLEPSSTMMTGKTILHYQILEKLGGGRMGDVYAAEDTKLGRKVSLRFFPEAAVQDPVAFENCKRDALAASAFNHPHICNVQAFDEYDGQHFIVTELLEGETLRQLLAWQISKRVEHDAKTANTESSAESRTAPSRPPGPARLPVDMVLELGMQIADALDAAHFRGILHRDIKPSNIFITKDGQAKIMDFGLARITVLGARQPATGNLRGAATLPTGGNGGIEAKSAGVALDIQSPPSADADSLTSPAAETSAFAYLSPEQVREEELDARSDLFSFGTVLYEMATGRQVFSGKSPELIRKAILQSTPAPVGDVDRRLPQRLSAIIGKLMERDRELRYPSAMEARGDLKRLKLETDVAGARSARHARTDAVPSRRAARSQRRARRHVLRRMKIGATALAGVAALMAVIFVARQIRLRRPAAIPIKRTQVSHWNKPMNAARLSPDGNTVAFTSPVSGVDQVFMMLASGGEPMQLTGDPGEKYVDGFAPDSREIYYGGTRGRDEEWAVPTFGGAPHRVASGRWLAASPDGDSLFFLEPDSRALIRSSKSAPGEEMVHFFRDPPLVPWSILPFPDGHNLLVTAVERPGDSQIHLYQVNVPTHDVADRGVVSGSPTGGVWADPGNSLLFSRSVRGFTHLWKYDLDGHSWTQVSFGPGPDSSPMPDPTGKGIYYVGGSTPGSLTVYHVSTKESVDIALQNISQPVISPNGKRVAYIWYPAPGQSELWVSELDGSGAHKVASAGSLDTGSWSHDSTQIFYLDSTSGVRKGFVVGADGRGLRPIAAVGESLLTAVWSADDQSLYVSGDHGGMQASLWKAPADGSEAQKLMDGCGIALDAAPDGKHLLSAVTAGDNMGIYQISVIARQCALLRPGISTLSARFAVDGGSFLYPLATHSDVTFYRQGWSEGKLVGEPAPALDLPFPFGMFYPGNTYDFARDLSSIVYARSSRKADLFFQTPAP